MADHIFISYARNDSTLFAKKLYRFLLENNYTPWLDVYNIKPGDIWQEQCDNAIRTCWMLIFLGSPESVVSRTCSAEWNRALKYKKAVIPLMYKNAVLPFLLEQRQYISLVKSSKMGLKALLEYLSFLKSPEGEIQILQNRYDDLNLDAGNHPSPEVVKLEMQQLKEQIDFKIQAFHEPDIRASKYKKEVELGILKERNRFAKERENDQILPRRRIIGRPPIAVSKIFKNREPELTQILNTLISNFDIRIVSIYGKTGSGKTALACRAMQELERQKENIFGLTYHSTQDGNLNLDQIYFACGRIFGGNVEKALIQVWQSSISNLEVKIKTLLTFFQEHCIIILLDNLESLQGSDGEIKDADLKLFIEIFTNTIHKSRILLTSREALTYPFEDKRFEKIIPLDEGLSIDHAIDLLVELGKNRNLELTKPSKSTLKTAAELVYGYPRALEAIVGLLDEDSSLSLEDLIKESNIFNKKVLENLIIEAYSRLPTDLTLVMQALAVFERPIVSTGIMYLLEPFAITFDVYATLERLTRGYFVKVNRITDEYVIHPLDREYCYNLIPRDLNNSFNIKTLESRAAEYYALLQTPPQAWLTIADLEPQLLSFPHLYKSEDFERAAKLIDSIDSNYLTRWGYGSIVIKFRLKLARNLQDKHLQCINYAAIGESYRRMGRGDKAIDFCSRALNIAIEINDKSLENICLGHLGRILRNLGRVQEAVEYLKRAIEIAREIGDQVSEGRHIGNLGSSLYNIGDFKGSIKLLEQSIGINQALGEIGEVAERTGHLGNPYFHLRYYDKAIELYNKALIMSRELRQRRGEGYWLWLLGRVYACSGATTKGIGFLNKAADIANEVEDDRLQCFVLGTLAETYLNIGQIQQSLMIAEKANKIDVPELNANIAALYGIILARLGEIEDASESLDKAIRSANFLLEKTNRFFEAKYSRAISYATLALLNQGAIKTILLKEAEEAYLDAISYCSAEGVIERNVQLLKGLKALDLSGSLESILKLFPTATKKG